MSNSLFIHIIFALSSIFLGALILFMRKGTRKHRFIGRIWVVSMVITCISSFWLVEIFGFWGPIHLLSIWTLFCLFQAIRSIRVKNIKKHKGYMKGAYYGLVIAGLAALMPGRFLLGYMKNFLF